MKIASLIFVFATVGSAYAAFGEDVSAPDRIEIGQGALIRGPVSVTDATGRVLLQALPGSEVSILRRDSVSVRTEDLNREQGPSHRN